MYKSNKIHMYKIYLIKTTNFLLRNQVELSKWRIPDQEQEDSK